MADPVDWTRERLRSRFKAAHLEAMVDLYSRTFYFVDLTPETIGDADLVEVFNQCLEHIKNDLHPNVVTEYTLFIKKNRRAKKIPAIAVIPDPPVVDAVHAYKAKNWRKEAAYWIYTHPIGYSHFKVYCEQLKKAGRRFGINLIRERVRWESFVEHGDDRYKFCNSLSPYVARMLIDEDPALAQHIRCRKTKW